MTKVAVVAHARKTFGGGLGELRDVLAREGIDPLWYEVPKSKRAPKAVRKALKKGVDLVLVWGGDGMQQRCIDVLAGTDVALGILPAGTGNLLATNLDIPMTVEEAVATALRGERKRIDTGTVNGEHFAVMAGTGFDALMIKDADRGLKDRLGRAAYLWTGLKNISAAQVEGRVKVDGEVHWEGQLSCVLVGNVSRVFGAIEAFDGARPDDGLMEVGIVSAATPVQWTRAVARVVVDRAGNSPFVQVTRGRRIRVTLKHPLAYEIDGGDRPPTKKLRIDVRPASVVVCVPVPAEAAADGGADVREPELAGAARHG
jgi:diacylglycerol kinase family enzyme